MKDGHAERVGEANPAAAEVRTAATEDGRRVAYAEYGDPDGAPVVFLHGTPGSRLLGAVYDEPARRGAEVDAGGAPSASAAGVRVLAIDRPGCGRSSPRPTRTLSDTGAFVAAVLDRAGVSRAGVVGFSGGGPHALAVAATHGERVRGVDVVAGAVPPSLRSAPPTALRILERLAEASPTLTKGLMRAQSWVAARAPPSAVTSQYTAGDADELPDDTAELVRRDFVAAFARHRSGFVTETRTLSAAWDVSPADVGCPVRLWHGGRDDNVPAADAERLADRLPDATLTVFEEADHLRTLLRSRAPILGRYGSDSGESESDAEAGTAPSEAGPSVSGG